ncbi:hypothetical protein PC116_g18435 [Phytophthora cactorum]|nr:hypothetical protein PC116_g18435 [Phytophthora cactorum]
MSGYDPTKAVELLSLDTFASQAQAKIRRVASALAGALAGLDVKAYNVNVRVVDTLMPYLLRHYPSLKGVKVDGQAVQRIKVCAVGKGCLGERASSMVFTPVLYQKQRSQFR